MKSSELAVVLRDALTERLQPAGWYAAADGLTLVALSRPLDAGIEATVGVGSRVFGFGEPSYLTVGELDFGVAYGPLRRLAPLLGREFENPLRRTPAHEALLPEDTREVRLRTPDEVREIAERIGGLVLERGSDFASEHRTVDDLLTEPTNALDTVALLAAAHRFDAAASALEAWTPGLDGDHHERVLARRLRRYIDRRGDPALIPVEPPPDRFDAARPPRPSVGEIWRQGRARDAAVKAVAGSSRDTPREELRASLTAELAARSVNGDPIWIENALDHLWDTQAERWETAGSALLRVGRGIAKAISDRTLPDLHPPTWLEPPDFAGYAMAAGDDKVRVELDAGAQTQLERVHETMTTVFGMARLSAWLQPDGDGLAVHLGDQRVGNVPGAAVSRYRSAMELAAVRAEVPYLDAVLVRRPDGFLLQIPAPR